MTVTKLKRENIFLAFAVPHNFGWRGRIIGKRDAYG